MVRLDVVGAPDPKTLGLLSGHLVASQSQRPVLFRESSWHIKSLLCELLFSVDFIND